MPEIMLPPVNINHQYIFLKRKLSPTKSFRRFSQLLLGQKLQVLKVEGFEIISAFIKHFRDGRYTFRSKIRPEFMCM